MRQLFVSAVLLSALIGGAASAESTPSQLMRIANPTIPAGYRMAWTFKVEMETTDKADSELCTQIILANHMIPTVTVSALNKAPDTVFKIVGTREFAVPSEEADAALAQLQKAPFKSSRNFTWTIAQTAVPKTR